MDWYSIIVIVGWVFVGVAALATIVILFGLLRGVKFTSSKEKTPEQKTETQKKVEAKKKKASRGEIVVQARTDLSAADLAARVNASAPPKRVVEDLPTLPDLTPASQQAPRPPANVGNRPTRLGPPPEVR